MVRSHTTNGGQGAQCWQVAYRYRIDGACSERRVADVTEGQKTIPFATELETGKWMYDSDKWVPHVILDKHMWKGRVRTEQG